MLVKFKTEGGAEYALDIENSKATRLSGSIETKSRTANDGEWRSFHLATEPKIGSCCCILWGTPDMPTGKMRRTSPVVSITQHPELSFASSPEELACAQSS